MLSLTNATKHFVLNNVNKCISYRSTEFRKSMAKESSKNKGSSPPLPPPMGKAVTVQSQIKIIQILSFAEIGVSFIILLCQTIAIAASYEFSTRNLTGVWTSWFFITAAGLALFWTVRCTFNGLLTVLVLQIIAGTMAIPLFTACCIMLGVYNFVWDDFGAMVPSSITIMTTNIVMLLASVAEIGLTSYNAYKCYFLAYGGQPSKENNYDRGSISSSESVEGGSGDGLRTTEGETGGRKGLANTNNVSIEQHETKTSNNGDDDPSMPLPPPDLSLLPMDLLIIKCIGMTGVILSVIIFCSQTAMLALANNDGIKIGVGVWGGLYYFLTGITTVYSGWKPSAQSTITIFSLQLVQLVVSIPLVCIAYYILAAFGSCLQAVPFQDCSYKGSSGFGAADLAVTILGGLMAICGMVQGLLSLILILICAQAVCGIKCMISGATVYPML